MPSNLYGSSRQRILQVVKEVSVSIDYVLAITCQSISPDARAELTALMLDYFWEADSQDAVQIRAIELLTELGNGTMDNNNIMELFQKSVKPVAQAPVFNTEFRDCQIERVVVSEHPKDDETKTDG